VSRGSRAKNSSTRTFRPSVRHLRFIERPLVVTSARLFDRMSLWRTFVQTHPVITGLAWCRRGVWTDWYDRLVR
jgi:hypothetical protein